MLVVLVHAPEDAPIKRALAGCGHSGSEHLALLIEWRLRVAEWQRAGDKRVKAPKLADCMLPEDMRETQRFGDASMTLDEVNDWLGWEHPAA